MIDDAPPDQTVLVRHRLTRQDVADILSVRARPRRRLIAASAVTAVLAVAVGLVTGSDRGLAVAVAAPLVALIALQLRALVRLARVSEGAVLTVEFGPSGVAFESGAAAGHLPWAGLETRHDGRAFTVLRGGRPLLVLPASMLSPSDLERVVRWAGSPAAVSPAADGDAPGQDAVVEHPDGTLTVRGLLTMRRARRLTMGVVRPSVWGGIVVVLVVAVGAAWAMDVPRLQAGLGPSWDTLLITLTAAVGTAGSLVVMQVLGRRVVARLAGRPVEWHFTTQGVTTTSVVGQTFAGWELVRDAVLNGDLLVVRHRSSSQVVGYVVGPLSPEQLRRVTGWVAARSGRRVVGA